MIGEDNTPLPDRIMPCALRAASPPCCSRHSCSGCPPVSPPMHSGCASPPSPRWQAACLHLAGAHFCRQCRGWPRHGTHRQRLPEPAANLVAGWQTTRLCRQSLRQRGCVRSACQWRRDGAPHSRFAHRSAASLQRRWQTAVAEQPAPGAPDADHFVAEGYQWGELYWTPITGGTLQADLPLPATLARPHGELLVYQMPAADQPFRKHQHSFAVPRLWLFDGKQHKQLTEDRVAATDPVWSNKEIPSFT